MQRPDISVIIPHLNQEEFLEKCLASLAQQTIANVGVEIIVVDNGSAKLPRQVIEKYPAVRLEQEATPGPGPARNTGVGVARGNILAFIDADCTAEEGWLAAIWHNLSVEGAARIIGGDVRIPRASPGRTTMLEAYESVYAYRQQEYIEKKGFSGTGNLAMCREIFEAVGPFGGIDIAEDRDWGLRAVALGYRLQYCPGMIVFHPARRSVQEIYEKWDRQVRHSFQEFSQKPFSTLQWVVYALAVAVSPVAEAGRVFRSNRLHRFSERMSAIWAMSRIRGYRSRRMISMLFSEDVDQYSSKWNR